MRKYFAEVIGTFALVFSGCGAIVVNDLHNGLIGHLGISLVFGFVVMAMIYSVGNISGAHLNPAVSLGFFTAGRIKGRVAFLYVVSQLCGAIIASLVLRLLFSAHPDLGATSPSGGITVAFATEVIFTFILMFVILNVSTGHFEKGVMAGVAVGGTIALAALVGGPLSGASLNPARSLGPALISGKLVDIWLYLLAPCIGALLASPLCRLIQGEECCAVQKKKGKIQDKEL